MRIWVIFYLLLFLSCEVFSQNRKVTDSLLIEYNSARHDSTRLEILDNLSYYHPNVDSSLYFAELLLQEAIEQKNEIYMAAGYFNKGNAYRLRGDFELALKLYLESVELWQKIEYNNRIGETYITIGDIYNLSGGYINALEYYGKALAILEQLNDSVGLAAVYINKGDVFLSAEVLDSALAYFELGAEISSRINHESYRASALGNIGLVFAKQGKHDLAENNIHEASRILGEFGDLYPISIYLPYMADIYMEKGDSKRALQYAHESLQIGQDLGLKEPIRDASLKLSELYKKKQDYRKAFEYQTLYIAFRDSINNEETIRKMADQRTQYEVGLKQKEVDLLTVEKANQRKLMVALAVIIVLVLIVVVVIHRFYRSKNRINKTLETQKAALEELNQTKDKFFSIISHDLRGPISAFNGVSRMIKFLVGTKQPDLLLELAEDIDQSVDRLSALLDNLLNWALQQQGHFPNVPEKVDLNELIGDLQKVMFNMAKSKKIRLVVHVDPNIRLWADRNTTETILRNLVNNALKFTPEGGEVSVWAKEQGEVARIEVKDTGVGIPQDKLNKLFRLNDKKSTYGTKGEKGLGLGLQLVHEFVLMNQGRIEVNSREGEGTTFVLFLPLFEPQKIISES